MRFYVQDFADHTDVDHYARLKIGLVKTLQWVFRMTYNRLRKALGSLPYTLPDQYVLQKLAAPHVQGA
jgi:hypothetical protein